MERYFNFLYIRSGNKGVRTIRLHRLVVLACCAVLAALLIGSTGVIVGYSGRVAAVEELERLKKNNTLLGAEIERFKGEMEDLRKSMEITSDLHNRARLLASLEPLSDDVRQAGIGGPELAASPGAGTSADALLGELGEDLDGLIRQSAMQIKSYDEVISILEKEQSIRETTPSVRPLRGGFLSSRYGRRMDPFTGEIGFHSGLDYRAPNGSPVVSTAGGIVSFARKNGGFGLMVEVTHGDGFKTRYCHLSRILVKRGQHVKRGEMIGLVGNTGHSTGSHLHYEVMFRKVHRDPLQYIIPSGAQYD